MGARALRVWRESTRSALAPTTASIAGAVNIQPSSAPTHQTCVRLALPTPMHVQGATATQTVFAMRATRGAMGARARRVWQERTRSTRAPGPALIAGAVNIQPPSAPHQTCVRRALPTPSRLKGATSLRTASRQACWAGAQPHRLQATAHAACPKMAPAPGMG